MSDIENRFTQRVYASVPYNGSLSVIEIWKKSNMKRGTVMKHLELLRADGLVTRKRVIGDLRQWEYARVNNVRRTV